MYLFEKEIQAATALTMTGATKTISLDETVDYSELLLRFAFTADASQVDHTKYRVADWLTSITVIGDDDKYVINATARELAALHFFRTRHEVHELCHSEDNFVNILELPVYFGRYVGDKEYFLPKNLFSKLELNVTNGDSATGNFFDAGTLEVRGLIFKDHALSPIATLRTKQIKDWTPASSTESMTEELPDKHRIEKILIQSLPTYQDSATDLTAEAMALLDKIKLTYKGGDRVIFDDDMDDLVRRNAAVYGLAHTHGLIDGQEDDFWDSGLAYRTNVQAVCGQDPSAADLQASCLNATTQKVQLKAQGVAADNEYYFAAWGMGYLDHCIFDFAPRGIMEDLYDPAMYAKGELKLTAGSTAGSIQIVVVEEVRSFS